MISEFIVYLNKLFGNCLDYQLQPPELRLDDGIGKMIIIVGQSIFFCAIFH